MSLDKLRAAQAARDLRAVTLRPGAPLPGAEHARGKKSAPEPRGGVNGASLDDLRPLSATLAGAREYYGNDVELWLEHITRLIREHPGGRVWGEFNITPIGGKE